MKLLAKSPVFAGLVPTDLESLSEKIDSFNKVKSEKDKEEDRVVGVISSKIMELVTDQELHKTLMVLRPVEEKELTVLFRLVRQAVRTGEKAAICESGYLFINNTNLEEVKKFIERINSAAACLKEVALFYAYRNESGICLTLTLY